MSDDAPPRRPLGRSLNPWPKRRTSRAPNPPTLSVQEAATEFGTSLNALAGALHARDAPEPCLRHRKATYYQAATLRAWWKAKSKE